MPPSILKRAPFLPNLRMLLWGSDRLDLASWFFLPSLRHFELDLEATAQVPWLRQLRSCLYSLADSPVILLSLTLNACDSAISTQLRGFRHLVRLCLPYSSLSKDVWRDLASLSSLRLLMINNMVAYPSHRGFTQTQACSSTTGFTSVRSLVLMGSWDEMLSVARDLPCSHITLVNIWFPETQWVPSDDDMRKWRDIVAMLSRWNTRGCMLNLHPMDTVRTMHIALEPLFTLSSLTRLHLVFNYNQKIVITDGDIRWLVSSVPRLTHLVVHLLGAPNTMTVWTLIHIATTVPKLEFLDMEINIEKDGVNLLPAPEEVPVLQSPQTLHLVLRFKPAPPLDLVLRRRRARLLGNILDIIFPQIRHLEIRGRWRSCEEAVKDGLGNL